MLSLSFVSRIRLRMPEGSDVRDVATYNAGVQGDLATGGFDDAREEFALEDSHNQCSLKKGKRLVWGPDRWNRTISVWGLTSTVQTSSTSNQRLAWATVGMQSSTTLAESTLLLDEVYPSTLSIAQSKGVHMRSWPIQANLPGISHEAPKAFFIISKR